MIHEINKDSKVTITDDLLTFKDLYNKDYFPSEHIDSIKKANILLIPYERFRDVDYPIFPEETSVFFEYLNSNLKETDIVADICMDDEHYRELELHADAVNIPIIITTMVALPIVLNITSAFLYDKYKQRREEISASVNIIVECKGDSKKIEYKGSAKDFKDCMESISKNLFKEGE